MTTLHSCPGCDRPVPRHLLACKPCWFRLPKHLRDDVNAGYAVRGSDPVLHRRALHAALAWYRIQTGERT